MVYQVKPHAHYRPPPGPIPALPASTLDEILAALRKGPSWAPSVSGCQIQDLRNVLERITQAGCLEQKPDMLIFEDVVIHDANLGEMTIPFDVVFDNVFLLNGLALSKSEFPFLSLSGYASGNIELVETKGKPRIQMCNLQADAVYIYGGDGLAFIDLANSDIDSLTLAATTIERIELHDDVEINDLWLERLSVTDINVLNCRLHGRLFRVREVKCSGYFRLEATDVHSPMTTSASSCGTLSLAQSRCWSHMDLRGLTFARLALPNAAFPGRLFLDVEQLLAENARETRGSLMDKSHCLSNEGTILGSSKFPISEQFAVLRNCFRLSPSMNKQEDYCAYQTVKEVWKSRTPRLLWAPLHWLVERCLGYLLRCERIAWTMACAIAAFAVLYAILAGTSLGDLPCADQGSAFDGGLFPGLGRCLYFSAVTFATLGYGDVRPTGLLQLFACVEALLGLALTSLLAVSLARKLLRW